MAATKDQRRLLCRCIENEIPVFVLTGIDACALAALTAYVKAAEENMCTEEFIRDLKENILPDFETFQKEEPNLVKLPD